MLLYSPLVGIYATQAEIAEFMGVNRTTAAKGVRELIKLEFVEVVKRGSYRVKEIVGQKLA